MSIEADQVRLSQNKMLEPFLRDMKMTEMVTVYFSDSSEFYNRGIYCALIPAKKIEKALSSSSWDLMRGQGVPSAVGYHRGGEERVEYLRFGNDEGIEPLVIEREFYELRNDYNEICEEFRLFHKLFHDRKSDNYFKFDDEGNEILVASVKQNLVKMRLKEIRQFLAIKEMYLSIQFDFKEFSQYSLEELRLEEGGGDHRDGLICWRHNCGDSHGSCSYLAFSRLLGVSLIAPLPKSKSGFPGFTENSEKRPIEFIIGVDDNGDEITAISTPDAPDHLTPVFFRKQVLDKYYQKPGKYSVNDSVLWCGSLWYMHLDNHHDDKVCAWLGDLGRGLPYGEQLHWRTFNIPPEGGVSETFFKRQIEAKFTDSDRPEHIFQQRYHDLEKVCDEYLGWQLLRPLNTGDEHHLKCVRIPATDEQRDFDELVLGLTKILIDSLNEKYLNKLIPVEHRNNVKASIARLEAALTACGVQDIADHISFLRKLQNLRSSSAAHRKGSNYQKIANEFGIESQSLRVVFAGILSKGLELLDYFIDVVRSGQLNVLR
jgi:hypothetical protein